MSILSDRLKELRGPSSQAEMARQLGIQRTQWIKYENGDAAPGAEILTRICRVHACSADWLLGLDDKLSGSQKVFGSVKAGAGGIAIGGVGNRVSGTLIASDNGHAPTCAKCPYKKWGEKLRKQGLVIPGLNH